MDINATLVAQIFNFLMLIAIFIVVPVLVIKLFISRSTLFKNVEKLTIEITEIRKLLEEKLNK